MSGWRREGYRITASPDLNTLFPASANLFATMADKISERGQISGMAIVLSAPDAVILMPLLDLLAFKTDPLSVQNVVIDLILLPVCLLGGYLKGKWRWQDLEKKYPADTLPFGE
jgi:hypothetical protein